MERSRLNAAVDRLEQQHALIESIAWRTDEGRLRDLIQLRRELSKCIASVGDAGSQYFRCAEDAASLAQFRNHFSNMRARTATHQADWPAVRLAEGGEEYAQSAQAVNEAIKGFVGWVRDITGRR